MHTPRARHTATLLSNGEVLLVGSSSPTGSAEIFDPTDNFSGTGVAGSGLCLPHGDPSAEWQGSRCRRYTDHAARGRQCTASRGSLDTAEIYDPSAGTFEAAGKLVVARDSHSATLLPNGTMLLAGGYTHDFDGDAQPEWYTMFTARSVRSGYFDFGSSCEP